MKSTVVRNTELGDTWAAEAYLGEGAGGCHLCGLTPGPVRTGRAEGGGKVDEDRTERHRSDLLELDGPVPGDPLRRSRYRCRNRKGCEVRQELRRRRVTPA